MDIMKKWSSIKNKKRKVWCASLLIVIMLSACTKPVPSSDKAGKTPLPSENSAVSTSAPDIQVTFSEVLEGESYYLKFSEFTLIPREGPFAPPPQEAEYTKKVSSNELKSFHGLSIGMTANPTAILPGTTDLPPPCTM